MLLYIISIFVGYQKIKMFETNNLLSNTNFYNANCQGTEPNKETKKGKR